MKIIRIVVDKLPRNCADCISIGICYEEGNFCGVMNKDLSDIKWASTRPDWCPLVEMNEEVKFGWVQTIEKVGMSEFITVKNVESDPQ